MAKLTEAEKAARYDAEKNGSAYTKPIEPQLPVDVEQEIARECDRVIAEHRTAEQPTTPAPDEEEDRPIPAELAGSRPDQPFIGHEYAGVSVLIDRRDGGLMIARKGEIGARLLERDEVIALHRFFGSPAVERVIMYHWREQVRQTGSPELCSLLDWIDAHFAAEEAAA